MSVETHSFQTEVQQLLNLMIHSLYSNKEIFLRELISNSSDALDKLRFEEVTNQNLLVSNQESAIRLSMDKENGILFIEDNGIGMDKEELIANLGTIASSGTKKYLEKLTQEQKNDANMIGQFGVGFYSAFMVGQKIVVESVSAKGGAAHQWESNGDGSYTIREIHKETRGTKVSVYLKEDEKAYLDSWKLREVVRKYSNYVTYPIFLLEKEEAKEGSTEEPEIKEDRLNQTTPVWAKNKRENKPEEYKELYKQISNDWNEPLLWEHLNVEGTIPFQAVVFVPSKPPFDLMQRVEHGLHLYVKRVSISEKCKELLPEYLRFVSGVVETDELPLNVSREILQQNNKLPHIKKQIVKKILGSLQNLANNESEKYIEFYKSFGSLLKEGFHFDVEQHEALSELVRFKSTKTGKEGWTSFKNYLDGLAENQKEIYYLSGLSYEALEKNPHLESFASKGIEVLLLCDPIDEWFVSSYSKHKEYALKAINKGDIDLSSVGSESVAENSEETKIEEVVGLLDLFRNQLRDEIKDVKISKRLRESACCLVNEEHGMSPHMERMMKAAGQFVPPSKRILEINTNHPLIKNLVKQKNSGSNDDKMSNWVDVLYETALISEGSPIKNPGDFALKLTKIMESVTSV